MLTVDFDKLHINEGDTILDAGCGSGRHLTEVFRFPGVRVVGVDLNLIDLKHTKDILKLMEAAGEKNNAPSIEQVNIQEEARDKGRWFVLQSSLINLPFKDGTFQTIICSEVLEHIVDNLRAVKEMVRVLKNRGTLVVSVPRYLPERLCWAISRSYHQEPGGHIIIYRKKELLGLLKRSGLVCYRVKYRHALHSPYWWLKCLVGHKNDSLAFIRLYRRFLEWDIIKRPKITGLLEKLLNPLFGKSIVFYLRKET